MTSMVLGDSTLESLTPSVNAPLDLMQIFLMNILSSLSQKHILLDNRMVHKTLKGKKIEANPAKIGLTLGKIRIFKKGLINNNNKGGKK